MLHSVNGISPHNAHAFFPSKTLVCAETLRNKNWFARHRVNVHKKGEETKYCEVCETEVSVGYGGEGWKLHEKRKHRDKEECPECKPVLHQRLLYSVANVFVTYQA